MTHKWSGPLRNLDNFYCICNYKKMDLGWDEYILSFSPGGNVIVKIQKCYEFLKFVKFPIFQLQKCCWWFLCTLDHSGYHPYSAHFTCLKRDGYEGVRVVKGPLLGCRGVTRWVRAFPFFDSREEWAGEMAKEIGNEVNERTMGYHRPTWELQQAHKCDLKTVWQANFENDFMISLESYWMLNCGTGSETGGGRVGGRSGYGGCGGGWCGSRG